MCYQAREYFSGDVWNFLPVESLANETREGSCSNGSGATTSVNTGVLVDVSVYDPLCEESPMQM